LVGDDSESHYNGGRVKETISAVLKFPRQCPIVILVRVRLVFGINTIWKGCKGGKI
jgi:hypothetical protein